MKDKGISETNSTFIGFPTLTEKENIILHALLNPEYKELYRQNKRKFLDTIGVSKSVFYLAMQKREFLEILQGIARDTIRQEAYDLIQASIRHAKGGSFKHMELLLDMIGMTNVPDVRTSSIDNFVAAIKPSEEDMKAIYDDKV